MVEVRVSMVPYMPKLKQYFEDLVDLLPLRRMQSTEMVTLPINSYGFHPDYYQII